MKTARTFIVIAIILFAKKTFAQLGINASNTPPSPSAMLDVSSTTKGVLLPRMTTAQRTALTTSDGLTVYDTDTKSYWFVKGTVWTEMAGSTGPWTVSNNNISNNNSGNIGIGNADPNYILDISKRIRLRSESPSLGAGIWFNKSNNSGLNVFLGNDVNDNFQVFSGTRTIAKFIPADGGFRVEGPVNSAPNSKTLSIGRYGSVAVDHWLSGDGGRLMITESGNVGIGTIDPATKLTVNGEITSTNAIGFRMVQGNYGSMLRNDGNFTSFLLTNSGDQYGNLSGARPFTIGNVTGDVYLGGSSLLVKHGGNVYVDASNANSGNITSNSLIFGQVGSGEGIASKRDAGGNQYGLDFYTNFTNKMSISNTGNVGIGNSNPSAMLEVSGYTKLGNDAPAIKVKKLNGTTASTQGGSSTIIHGLNVNKILSVSVLVESIFPGEYIPANYDASAALKYSYLITNNLVYVINAPAPNSANILVRPIKVLITYEE
jgi:hypothetical protein